MTKRTTLFEMRKPLQTLKNTPKPPQREQLWHEKTSANPSKHNKCLNNISCTDSRPISQTASRKPVIHETQTVQSKQICYKGIRTRDVFHNKRSFTASSPEKRFSDFFEKSVASHSSWCCQADCSTYQTQNVLKVLPPNCLVLGSLGFGRTRKDLDTDMRLRVGVWLNKWKFIYGVKQFPHNIIYIHSARCPLPLKIQRH